MEKRTKRTVVVRRSVGGKKPANGEEKAQAPAVDRCVFGDATLKAFCFPFLTDRFFNLFFFFFRLFVFLHVATVRLFRRKMFLLRAKSRSMTILLQRKRFPKASSVTIPLLRDQDSQRREN